MSKKLLVAGVLMSLVAVMLVAGATAPSAAAQSMSLCQTVDALVLAGVIAPDKVAAAKAAAGCGATAPAACSSFTRNLTVGSTGQDVTNLQVKLNVTPATGYFGAITKAAVVAYQTANGITPAAGYVGPVTLAKLNTCAIVVPPVTPGTTPSTDLSGDEGDVKSFTVLASPSNEDVAEGETVKVFGFEVEASDDSDLAMKRLDVVFDQAATLSDSPWDAIESARLLQGSTEIASVDDLDSKSSWTEVVKADKSFRIRFTNIDGVIKAGAKAKFYVEVTASGSIDEGDYTSASDFAVYIPANGMRVIDGAGLDMYEPSSNSSSKTVDIGDLQAADVTVTDKTDSPDAKTIIVDVDNDTNGEVLLTGEIESEDDAIVLNTIRVYATSSIATYLLVADLKLEIDGEEYSGTISDTASTSPYYDFDIDGDVTIDEDSSVGFSVLADFNKNATGTISVAVPGNTTAVDAESENTGDTVTSIAGSANGETMTLALLGVDVSLLKKTMVVTSGESAVDDYVTGTFEVKISNGSKDTLFVPLTAQATTTATSTNGVNFFATIGGGATSSASVAVQQITSLAEESSSVRIQKGQSATIEVIVTFKPGVALTTYKLELDTVKFSENAGNVDQVYTAPATSAYRTSTVTIVN